MGLGTWGGFPSVFSCQEHTPKVSKGFDLQNFPKPLNPKPLTLNTAVPKCLLRLLGRWCIWLLHNSSSRQLGGLRELRNCREEGFCFLHFKGKDVKSASLSFPVFPNGGCGCSQALGLSCSAPVPNPANGDDRRAGARWKAS